MHLDNIFFLVLLGVAALFKWLSQKTQEPGKGSDPSKQEGALHPSPTESEEERMRRFFEALGRPTSAPAPRNITPESTASPKRAARRGGPLVSPLPPLTTRPPVEAKPPPSVAIPPPLPSSTSYQSKPSPAEAPVFEVRRDPSPPPPDLVAASIDVPSPSRNLVTTFPVSGLLVSADDLRRAVILREVLGPPRSLQSARSLGPVA